ncbi:MAG: TIR domain-containing protein [Catenibacterium mitsuokai]|nr:toll/interleukin-1 receptor domain-containing protein [Catenibacterium mitsuokai]MDD6594715.1 TIR domain-containing protein [Catenibacterium mitsuokai]
MSIETRLNKINNLNDRIAKLREKIAAESRNVSSYRDKANKITVGKTDSESRVKSKMSTRQNYLNKAVNSEKRISNFNKEIAKLYNDLNRENKAFQKEEAEQRKKEFKQNQDIKKAYENRIKELESQTIRTYAANTQDVNTVSLKKYDQRDFDVFISYASEDKEFVDCLVKELKNLEVNVWFDYNEISWGDNLRKSIDNGLRFSHFGIVILSPHYINPNKYWTAQELEGLMQAEGESHSKLLPVWHNLTKQDVLEYSPILASKKALTTAVYTAKELAKEFQRLLKHVEY